MLTFAAIALTVAALLIISGVVAIMVGKVVRNRDTQVPREDDKR